MRRFSIQPPTAPNCRNLVLDKEESLHITKVLRLLPGVGVELYDGTGFLYQATITTIGKAVTVHIQSKEYFPPPQPKLILHTGLLKNKKMEFVLQKATELGTDEVHIFISDHTSVPGPKSKRMTRYHKIIQEACKQCERIHPMLLFPPTPFTTQIEATKECEQRYLFWERETKNDPSSLGEISKEQNIHIFIGPEGGFSQQEIDHLQSGVKTLSLGPQILRAETAVITGLSIISFLAGRFKH